MIAASSFPYDLLSSRQRIVRLVVVTPSDAKSILDSHNDKNRKISHRHVTQIASDIKSGRWHENGETIIFGSDGSLMDGQHRLAACVQAKAPICTLVAFGYEPGGGVSDTHGRARPRTVRDTLWMRNEKYASRKASVLALVWRIRNNKLGSSVSPSPVEHVQIVAPGIEDIITRFEPSKSIISPTFTSFVAWAGTRGGQYGYEEFAEKIVTGANMGVNDPVLRLRNFFLNRQNVKHGLVREKMKLALIIKAWNHHVLGKEIRLLRWVENSEAFPEIFGYDYEADIKSLSGD